MGDWIRCANCRYIRHSNDNGRYRPDTCPKCGAVYRKAEFVKEKERRRRSFRAHRSVRTRPCTQCREPVPVYANNCPLCDQRLTTPPWVIAATIACGFAVIVAAAWLRQNMHAQSPYPGLSDTHYERCVELSVALITTREREGVAAAETLKAQNNWHAQCSRKALRDIDRASPIALPTTPREWVYVING